MFQFRYSIKFELDNDLRVFGASESLSSEKFYICLYL